MSVAAKRSHRGDEYQLKVAVHWVTRLLSETELDWVQIDSVILPGEEEYVYVDDIVLCFKGGTHRYIQAKIHQTDRRAWSISDLTAELIKARNQLDADPRGKVIFYSQTPFGDLAKLIEDSRDYETYEAFSKIAPDTLLNPLKKIAQVIERSPVATYSICQQMGIGPHHTMENWDQVIRNDLLRVIPDPDKALPVLERLARKNQAGLGSPLRLTRSDVVVELEKHGIVRAPQLTETEILEYFKRASSIGRKDIPREIAGEKLNRVEINQIAEFLEDGEKSILLVDRPGTGKTWILLELTDIIESKNHWGVLLIKGDRFDDINSESVLQNRLGFPDNDIPGLAARLASHRKVLIIIDSLDALSLSRDQKALKVFLALMDRLEIVDRVSLVVACREFDLSYDPLLRDRKWSKKVNIAALDYESSVSPILRKWGVDPINVTKEQQNLLIVPGNLKLFERLVGKVPLESLTSSYHFLDSFIEEVVAKDSNLGSSAVSALQEMARTLLQRRSLFMHKDSFKGEEEIYRRLVSAEILQIDTYRNRIAFSHQTLLDTLITRESIAIGKSLEELILEHPPLPFIRPAVRAFLFYLRVHAPELFHKQVRRVFENQEIAYHLRRLIAESLAEIKPTSGDLEFFEWLLIHHKEMFRRFLWTLKGPDWFALFASDLFQKLLKEPTYETLKIDFISKLQEWMNIHSKEVISFWIFALKDDDRLADEIIFALDKFECWETEGIRELLDLLVAKSKGGTRRFIGKAISRYVERTDKGDDLLWNFIIANVSMDKLNWSFFNDYEGLQCSEHDFHTNTFLKDRICKSDQLLNLCLAGVEDWSSHYSSYYAEKLFRDSFLNFTSWVMKHERGDTTSRAPLLELLSGLEYALITRSKSYDNWWQLSEPLLRKTLEAAIAYLIIHAYRANIENNGLRIMEFLERSDIFKNGHLDYELGELIRDAFPYMDNDFQERLQRKILGFSSKKEGVAEEQEWVVRKIYEYVCWIPALFRFPEARSFVEKWTHKFGLWPLPPRAYSRVGWVRSPISVEQMLVLSDKTIVKLLMFYGKDMKHFYEEDRLIGGTDNVISTFRDCCAIDPVRFSPFVERIYQEKIYKEYAIAVMEGGTSHLSYRFGNVRSSDKWNPVEPLPDGPSLGVSILKWLNIYPDLWNNGYGVAWALRSCCYVLEEPEDVEWLILFLARLANHRDPDEVKQTVFSKDKTTITEDDLGHIALNSVRGIVAEAAIDLATNLLKKGKELPELLSILLIRFAKDRNAGVRAATLTNLPLLTHYDFELGWDIFSKAFKNPHGHLWSFGERFLYYQYHGNFETVRPYLDRMKVEAIESAGETWGRISTLCFLSGHLTEGQLFHDLVGLNGKGSWLGATEVFAANIGDSKTRGVCEEGILRILKNRPMFSEVLQRIDAMFDHLPVDGKEAEIRIAESFVTAFESGQDFCERHWFFDWVAKLSNNSPRSALEICDKILKKIAEADPPRHLWHAEGIVSASLRILREADELDDQEFIRRAIHFQDQLLQLSFPEIQEAMDKAGRD